MKNKEYVSWHDLLAAVTLLALSVEALANTIGELVVPNFKDFESSSPKAKIRIICEHANIEFNTSKTPFVEVIRLLRVRNKLAHPKYKHLRYESEDMPLKEAQKHYNEIGEVLHDIEKSLTPDMAYKSLNAVLALAKALRATLGSEIMPSSSKRLIINGLDLFK